MIIIYKIFYMKNGEKLRIDYKNKNLFSNFQNSENSFEMQSSTKEEEKIKWDIYHEEPDGFIKCRVDKENKVNVLVQNTFFFIKKKEYQKLLVVLIYFIQMIIL